MNRVNAVSALFGVAFGSIFAAAGFNQYDVIHRMLLLENWDPFLVMGSAMATALSILWVLERRHWRSLLGGPLTLRRWPVESKHVWGGVVFGTGWAIPGACPGTASTALGSGSLMGGVLLLGIVAGIGPRDLVTMRTMPTPSATPDTEMVLETAAASR